jgi:hypothetical protein
METTYKLEPHRTVLLRTSIGTGRWERSGARAVPGSRLRRVSRYGGLRGSYALGRDNYFGDEITLTSGGPLATNDRVTFPVSEHCF